MKKLIKSSLLSTVLLMFFFNVAYAEWIDNKEAVLEGTNWSYTAAYGDMLVFDAGNRVAGKKIQRGAFLYDVKTGKLKPISSALAGKVKGFYGNSIVYKENNKIFIYDVDSKKIRIVGNGDSVPDIFGDLVVTTKGETLLLYDLNSGEKKIIKLSGKVASSNEFGPTIYGDKVVWIEKRGKYEGALLSYTISTGKIRKEADLSSKFMKSTMRVLRLRGDIVLLSTQKYVYTYDMEKGTLSELKNPGGRVFLSSLNDSKIVWDHDGGDTLTMYNLEDGTYTDLTSRGTNDVTSAIYLKNKVFFVDTMRHQLRSFDFKGD